MTSPAGHLRAVVLCAGLGTRLRPLTSRVPKPLLPVAGRPLLAFTLARLAAVGCERAAINLHHLGSSIRQAFGDSYRGLPLTYSEEPTILGTLGALRPLRAFLSGADTVLIVNADTLCEWPLAELLARHRAAAAAATLLLSTRADPARFGGGVGIDREGRVVALAGATAPEAPPPHRWRVFAGAHVLQPALLERLPEGFSDSIHDLYLPLLRSGTAIATLATRRRWHDLGTPRRYLEGVLETRAAGWRAPGARVAANATIERSVLEKGSRVAAGATLDRVLLLPGAQVGEGAALREAIVDAHTVVPAGARIEAALVSGGREHLILPFG
jgi:NDP-sugar pyrophosphorylase family protein